MSGEIYKLTSPSGKCYIGQTTYTSEFRWVSHIRDAKAKDGGRCRLLNNAIRKHGEDRFELEIILKCNKEILNHYEEKFILLYQSNNSDFGYNLRLGGNLSKLADSTKKLMSEAKQGDKHNNWGKKASMETKLKIQNTLIEKTIRVSHDNEILPKYIKYIKWVDREGYAIVSHPKIKIKYFVSVKKSNEEKLRSAIEYLARSSDIRVKE